GIIIPVLPSLVAGFVGGDAKRTAEMLGLFGTAWALMQFVFSPVQGALSDRFGRRPVILLSNFGLGLDYVLMALAPGFGLMSVAFGVGFILGPALGGLLGQVDPRLPFWVAGGLSLTNAAYGFLILP